tara:strand:- start:172 stop:591 length:420 start_codon:yes stop_codon:yes gene_type:complete
MEVKLLLDTEYNKTAPTCSIGSTTNEKQFTLREKTCTIACDLPFLPEDQLYIKFTNKDDLDDNVIVIKKIYIDDIDLQHFILKGTFEPIYNMDWFNKQSVKPPKTYSPCTELRHNGVWRLDIKKPIWKMMLENWMNDER